MVSRCISLIYLILQSYAGFSQCVELEPEDSIYGYRKRDGRCEGFYVANVSGFAIDVISLTQGPILFAMNSNEKLKISTLPLEGFEFIEVQGVNVSMQKNYRLDLILSRGQVAIIPVRDVIEPNRVEPSKLGLLGFVEKSGFKYFVPVIPASELVHRATKDENIKLSLSSNIDLRTFTWRYAKALEGICGEYSQMVTLSAPMIQRNSTIELDLPSFIVAKDQDTILCIQISVLGTNGMEFNENIRLLIPKNGNLN